MNRRTLVEKLIIMDRASKTGNITKTCEYFGISRISFYHIKKSIRSFRVEKQSMPQIVSADREMIIRDAVLTNPCSSNCEISKKLLSDHNIQLSHTAVHSVLKKLDLNKNEQRWLHFENQLKYGAFSQELSIRQRLFLQKHNLCFSAYHARINRPFEQLNLDVINVHKHRVCIAIDPSVNYAFALVLPKMDRKKIIDWLDTQVFSKAVEFGLPVKTVATSNLKLFDENIGGSSDYDAFRMLLKKHNLQRIDQHAIRPVLDGSIQYFYQLLLAHIEDFLAEQVDENVIAKKLTSYPKDYNNFRRYPYYPNYGMSPVDMVNYYLRHGKNWCGPKSLTNRFRGYISPVLTLSVKKPTHYVNKQTSSVYSAIVSLLFK